MPVADVTPVSDPPEAEVVEPVEGTAVEENVMPSVALAQRPTTGLLMPLAAPAEVREAMVAYQQTLDAILDATDWQGKPGAKGSFVKKSGWRKIAKAFGLSVQVIRDRVDRDNDGYPTRAETLVRAIGPNGQSMDGDGYCSADEPRFAQAGGRTKLENDLRATATTRAMNRAISSLVGFGEVSAEEVGQDGGALPAWAAMLTADEDKLAVSHAVQQLTGAPRENVNQALAAMAGAWGGIPVAVLSMLRTAVTLHNAAHAEPPPQPGTVAPPDLTGSPSLQAAALVKAGCSCERAGHEPYSPDCPLVGHGSLQGVLA